jgi:hypothetical protein
MVCTHHGWEGDKETGGNQNLSQKPVMWECPENVRSRNEYNQVYKLPKRFLFK